MEEPNIIVPTTSVNGNMTTCGIETQEISKEVRSIWSLREVTTYRSYNKCTGAEIRTYSVPSFTGLTVAEVMIVIAVVFTFLIIKAEKNIY